MADLITRSRHVVKNAEMPFSVIHVGCAWMRQYLPPRRFCTLIPLGFRADGEESQPADLLVIARDAAQLDAMPEWQLAIEARAERPTQGGLWSRFFKGSATGSVKLSSALLHEGPHFLMWPATREPLNFFSGDCSVVGEQAPHVDLLAFGASAVLQLVCIPR